MITIVHGWIIMDFTRERGNIWSSAPSVNLTGGPWTQAFQNIVQCGRCCQNKTFFSLVKNTFSFVKYPEFVYIHILLHWYVHKMVHWILNNIIPPTYMHLWSRRNSFEKTKTTDYIGAAGAHMHECIYASIYALSSPSS